jgi:hypothetical protein
VDSEERKIAALIAAFDAEQKRLEMTITALNAAGAQLEREVKDAARDATAAALKELNLQITKASDTLGKIQQFSLWRAAWQHAITSAVVIVVTLLAVRWFVPSVSQINELRSEQAALEASVTTLDRRGARIKLNTCGPSGRLCVMVDRIPGEFGGPGGEVYFIAKGY